MGLSFMHLVVVLVVVLIVFGAGRLPQVMGDLGKGLRNFKAGLNGESPDHLEKTALEDKKEPSKTLSSSDDSESHKS